MNYEDRTDLLPPEQVVSGPLLARLRLIPDAAWLMAHSLEMQKRSVSSAAYEAILLRAAEDTAPGSGAPAVARAAEEDAMFCGYRFGRLALGSPPRRRPVSPEEIKGRADSMYLYGLFVWDAPTSRGRVPVDVILSRHEAGQLHALEEAVTWAWSFGLGVALVEADLDDSEQETPVGPPG
jgi:hypothetical protein